MDLVIILISSSFSLIENDSRYSFWFSRPFLNLVLYGTILAGEWFLLFGSRGKVAGFSETKLVVGAVVLCWFLGKKLVLLWDTLFRSCMLLPA
jgi:hypothetical protein